MGRTICVATKEECNRECKRRTLEPNPIMQSYANLSKEAKDDKGECIYYMK